MLLLNYSAELPPLCLQLVSKQHARLELDRNGIIIMDLGSQNKTMIGKVIALPSEGVKSKLSTLLWWRRSSRKTHCRKSNFTQRVSTRAG